jgi:hypothetical protein
MTAGKLAFVAGESLFPLVITSGAILAGDVITKVSVSPIGPLMYVLSRFTRQWQS